MCQVRGNHVAVLGTCSVPCRCRWATAWVQRIAAVRARPDGRVTDVDVDGAGVGDWALATKRATDAIRRAGTKLETIRIQVPGAGRQAHVPRDAGIGLICTARIILRARIKSMRLLSGGERGAGGLAVDAGSDPRALFAAPIAIAGLADRIAAYRRRSA